MLARSLGWVSLGTLAQALLLNIALFLLGRNIGPAEFGKYSVTIALVNFFVLPLGYGIGISAAHFLARDTKASTLMMILVVFGICLIFFASLFCLFRASLTGLLGISQGIIDAAILFSMALSCYLLSENVCRGYGFYSALAALRAATAVIFCIALSFLWFKDTLSFTSPLWARTIPYLLTFAVLICWTFRNGLSVPTFEARPFIKYALSTTVASGASIFLVSADKLLLNRILPPEQIGIYSAYFLASYMTASRTCEVLSSVLFPEMSRRLGAEPSPAALTDTIRLGTWTGLTALFFATSATQYLASLILGQKFTLAPSTAFLFALGGSLYGIADLRWWVVAARGFHGVRPFALHASIAVCILMAVIYTLVPRLQVPGAALGLLAASIYFFTASLYCSEPTVSL